MNQFIQSILPSLHEGQQRIVCPFCEGGSSKERSFVITKQGSSVFYVCHRASCNARGKAVTKRNMFAEDTPMSVKRKQTPPSEALYCPRIVLNHLGEEVGRVWRRRPTAPQNLPKDINVIDEGWCMLHFPSPPEGDTCVIVEDIPSANRMDRYFPCVALLGTNFNEEKIELLLDCGIRRVIIALDEDATRKAIRLTRKYMLDTRVLPLQRDLKDESEAKLLALAEELLGEYYAN